MRLERAKIIFFCFLEIAIMSKITFIIMNRLSEEKPRIYLMFPKLKNFELQLLEIIKSSCNN